MKQEHGAIHIDSGDIAEKPLPSRLFQARNGKSMCCRDDLVSHSQYSFDSFTILK